MSITAPDVRAYTTKRLAEEFVVSKAKLADDGKTVGEPEVRKTPSPAQVNRELAVLKLIFATAIDDGVIGSRPKIARLKERNVRTGFFEREQYEAVLLNLPEELRGPVTFAYETGWRFA